MTDASEPADATTLSPDDAFAVLGNETRIGILQALDEADGPLSFTELRDRMGIRQGGRFNYHLDKLVGHFVVKTDDGYTLRQAGKRVTEAVQSGAVTDAMVLEPTRLDAPCPYCGADIEVSYRAERLLIRCTECVGSYAGIESASTSLGTLPEGTLTLYTLPSAGIQGRDPDELIDTALAWTYTEGAAIANGVCPRCAGRMETAVEACREHTTDGEICEQCNHRFAVIVDSECQTCNHLMTGTVKHYLLGEPRVRAFFEARGVDTLATAWKDMAVLYEYDEEVLQTEPFEGRFTFSLQGEELTVTVDEDLEITRLATTSTGTE